MTKPIYTADSETDPFKMNRIPRPFIWGLFDGDDYKEFFTTDDFVDYVSQIEGICYAHNGGKFDWHFFLHRFEQFEPIMVIAGRIAKFKIGLMEFRDSYNILPMPLSAYKKDEMDYDIMEESERHKPENWRSIRAYLKNDCVYLHEVISEFIDQYGMHLTQAGAALKIWSKISGIKIPHSTAQFYHDLSPYYYGGRVEVFESGLIEHDFKVIDINSAYPHAMKHLHPFGENYIVSDELPKTASHIQRAFIRLKCVSFGALPYRGENGLEFPHDDKEREYFITGWEYLTAVATETIRDVEIIAVTTFNDSVRFDDYVDKFYKLKTESEKGSPEYLFAKIFLNALYGKFAANPEEYDEYTIVNPCYIEAARHDDYEYSADLGPWALMSKPLSEEKQNFVNVAVAASITGFVRAYLWAAICQCEGVMYCDTDSIACRDTGELELDPTALGAWDTEAVCDFGGIAGKKMYAFRDKIKNDAKGMPAWKTASKGVKLTPAELIKLAEGNESIEYTPISPSFSLKRGIKFISRTVIKNA